MRKNQNGFTLVEGLLFVIALTLVASVGYFVYSKQNDDKKDTATQQSSSPAPSPAAATSKDTTKDWLTYDGTYLSLKYPKTWFTPKNSNSVACDEKVLLFGTAAESAGACQSDNMSQMAIFIADGDISSQYGLDKNLYPDIQTSQIKVDGVNCTKSTGTYNDQQASGELPVLGLENGTKSVDIACVTKGRTYYATHNFGPKTAGKDATNEFLTMMTSTVKFK